MSSSRVVRFFRGMGAAVLVLGAVLGGAATAGASTLAADPVLDAPVATTTTIVTDPDPVFGDPITLRVSVAGIDEAPAVGSVFVLIDGTTFGSGFPLVDGQVSIPIGATTPAGVEPFPLSGGEWTFEADFVPDDPTRFAPSSATTTITVEPSPVLLFVQASPLSVTLGQQVNLGVGLAHYTTVAPTGTVSWYLDGVLVATATVTDGFNVHARFTPAAAGTGSITAAYSGDANFSAASSQEPAALTVLAAPAEPTATPTPADTVVPGASGDGSTHLAATGTETGGLVVLAGTAGMAVAAGAIALFVSARRRRAAAFDSGR